MDQINKVLLNQLTQKIGVMKGMQMSDEEIEKSFDKSELDLIEKARSHKYIRKEGDHYIYEENNNDTRKVGRFGYSGPKGQENEYGGDLSDKPQKKSTPEEDAERERVSKLEEEDDLNQEKPSKRKEQSEKKEDVKVGDKIKVEGKKPGFFVSAKITGIKNDMISYETEDGDSGNLRKDSEKLVLKSLDIDIEKSENSKEQKVAKVMKEFKEGTLKSSSGELVTDRDQAIAIAMSEAGIKKEKSIESDIEKAEGERGGKIIGHTKSGKPIYEGGEHHKIIQSSFNLSPEHHLKTAESLRSQAKKLKSDLASGKYGQGATANSKLRELERRAKVHEDVYHIKKSNQ